MIGRRKTDPAEARTTLELSALSVPSPRTTPALRKASDERTHETVGPVLRGLAEEHRTETQTAADGLFQNPQTLDGTVSGVGEFGARKRLAQLLDQRRVTYFNAA